MLKIAICDREERDRKLILEYCINFLENKNTNYQIREYASGESFLAEDFPDVLFLNTEMEPIDGLLIKEILYKLHADTKIVFVSDQLEQMRYAFGKNVYGFILKPLSYTVFTEYMIELVYDIDYGKRVMYCKNHHKVERIYMRDVVYIKAYGRYTKVFLRGEEDYRLSDYSFSEWYLELENQEFLCCHRSYLVNLFYIKKIGKDIELCDGQRLPIGEKKQVEFWRSYESYMRRI